MEPFCSRSNYFTTVNDHCSSYHTSRLGNGQVDNQRKFSNLGHDSDSCGSDTADEDEDLFACDFGWRSSKQIPCSPIKVLLAEEMSRETEVKRRSPSVIARLMGFDGLPSQQPSRKQQNRLGENFQQRSVSPDKSHGKARFRGWSSRKSSKDEQEFKDVFEISDTLKMKSSNNSSYGTAQSNLTDAEIAFIRQKFMDAKRLSTDENLLESKEFHDTIEALNSNNDLLLKFLERPDSLFMKHVHDLKGAAHLSHCGHITAMKFSPGTEYNSGHKTERHAACRNRRKPNNDSYNPGHCKHASQKAIRPSKIQLDGSDKSTTLPTRIVVLKPNLGKLHSNAKSVLSPQTSHDLISECSSHTEVCSRDAELCRKKRVLDDSGPSRFRSRESSAITKDVTRHAKNSPKNDINFSTSRFKGYAGDESSPNNSENESLNESDMASLTSRLRVQCKSHHRPTSSRAHESSVSREAKKRLSERWKSTHKSIDMGVVSRGSTLGEMLSIPDREMKAYSDAGTSEKDLRDRFDGNVGSAGCAEPMGISSKDGWKTGCTRNLHRSRSLSSSSATFSSPVNGMIHEACCNDKRMKSKETVQQERYRALKGKINLRDGLSSKSSGPLWKRSYVSHYSSTDSGDSSPEIFSLKELHSSKPKGDSLDQDHLTCEKLGASVAESDSACENTVDTEIKNEAFPYKPTTDLEVQEDTSTRDLSAVCCQEQDQPSPVSVAELESSATSKEADQPSPVSVLETSFPNEPSSGSECFESLSADLHGLRMQLQLLKLESDLGMEGRMLISSDEDVEEGSAGLPERKELSEESKEFLYMVDVLLDSGIDDANPDTFILTWNSSDCPVNTQVFEELEKKYCSHSSWFRAERRLLFDRINSALLLWYQRHEDPHPWVGYSSKVRKPKWVRNKLEGCLYKMIAGENKKDERETTEKILATEVQWLHLGDEIDVIGREIERLLIDELVKEVVATL